VIAFRIEAKRLVDDAVVAKKLVEVAFVVEALVAAKLPVVVLLVVVRLLIVPVVVKSVAIVPTVVDALPSIVCPVTVNLETVDVAIVEVPVTAKNPVVVAFVEVRLVNVAVIAFRIEAKRLVDVAFVVELLIAAKSVAVALVVLKLEIVPDADVRSEMVPFVIVVVARVEVPVTVNVPFDVNEDVAVMFPLVSEENVAVIALRRVAKKLVDVAFVVELLIAENDVAVVVASVEVPTTVSFPFVLRFPCASARKFKFSVHAVPFQ
jgi:hypothetical protein